MICYMSGAASLHAVQCELSARFPEQIWCHVLDANKKKCYLGICYQTPTYKPWFDERIDYRATFHEEELCSYGRLYRFKTWSSSNANNEITREATEFYDCLEENFLYTIFGGMQSMR